METIRNYWKEWRLGAWFLGAGSAVFVAGVLTLLSAYVLPTSWDGVISFRDRLPLPAVLVSGKPVATYSEVAENLSGLRHFYESQDFSSVGMRVDFSTPDGKNRLKIREREVMNKMVEDEAIRRLSADAGFTISESEALQSVMDGAKANGSDEKTVRENVRRLYGWDLPRFIREVAVPNKYRERLSAWYESDASRFTDAKAKIAAAKKMLSDGRSFSDVASEYSEGQTADKSGQMGWFLSDQLVQQLQDPARTQKIDVAGDIVESPLGFHILLVNERKKDNTGDQVNVSQIFVKKQSFGEWLTERMKGMDVRVLPAEYQWNPEAATIEFRDPALRQAEQDLIGKSEGDASILF